MIQKYNCSFVEQQLNAGGQLIDVRSPVEFNRGALTGAVNIPVECFKTQRDDIDNTRPVLLYCRTGARSEMVKKYLEQLGFNQVHNIGGLPQFAGC